MIVITIHCSKKKYTRYKITVVTPNYPDRVHMNFTAAEVVKFVKSHKEQFILKYEGFSENDPENAMIVGEL